MARSTLLQAKDATQREQDALDTASALVSRWAPAPEPEPVDYNAKAARAERMLFRYILNTGGYKTSVNRGVDVLRRGESYDLDMGRVKHIIREEMGDYYRPATTAPII